MLPIARHNINLSPEELRLALSGALGAKDRGRGRANFEVLAAQWLGVQRAFAVASGRSALAMALRALELPDGAGVALPAYCFFSVVGVVEGLGLRPVFVAVDPQTMAMDPAALAATVDDVSCAVVIHPFGQVAPMAALLAACAGASGAVPLVEDASQSTGAGFHGRKAGTFGAAGVFSLVSGKNLQTFGGGLALSADAAISHRLEQLYRGAIPADETRARSLLRGGLLKWALASRGGFAAGAFAPFLALSEAAPARFAGLFDEARPPFDAAAPLTLLSDVQGSIGCLELAKVDERNRRRRDNALRLHEGLAGVAGLTLQSFDPAADNTFNAVAARVADARALARQLLRHGIDSRADYMQWYGPRTFAEHVLYLPNHPGMGARDVDRVVRAVRSCLGR